MKSGIERSVVLIIGAVVLLAIGGFLLSSGHMKTGIGLIVLGVIAVGISITTFVIARSSARG